jgi:hypothetical protein
MKSVTECEVGTVIMCKHHRLKVYRKWMFLLDVSFPFHGKPVKHILIHSVTVQLPTYAYYCK